MRKKLSEMTLEELWQLFPIVLTEHKEEWKDWYNEEEELLKNVLPMNEVMRISHIGSTSINRIWAKPTIDIMVEVKDKLSFSGIKKLLLSNGYLCMSESESRIVFNKGYTVEGFAERVFHLHLRVLGDNDELYFRDYLRENPQVAKEYEKLKLELWKKYEHNRDAYTDSKTSFVNRYTKEARRKYHGKYIMKINTDRLELVPLTCRQLSLWINNIKELEEELNIKYKAEPMEGFFLDIVKGQVEAVEKDDTSYFWCSFWFLIRKCDRVVIGTADFKDVPDKDGNVEIGYGLGKEFERNGYMTEAIRSMCNWALNQKEEGLTYIKEQ